MCYSAQIERDLHTRPLVLFFVFAFLVAGCATLSGPRLPSGDMKDWASYRIDVGNQVVRFEIPPDESPDFPAFEIPKHIDLSKSGIFDQAGGGPELLARYWDYRTSRNGQVEGTLSTYIRIWHSEKALVDENALSATLIENANLQRIKEKLQGGTGGPHNTMKFELAAIAGKQGLLVRNETSPAHYAVVLDAHHYLTIYINGAEVTRPGWRENAQAAAAAILKSIRIESNG